MAVREFFEERRGLARESQVAGVTPLQVKNNGENVEIVAAAHSFLEKSLDGDKDAERFALRRFGNGNDLKKISQAAVLLLQHAPRPLYGEIEMDGLS